MEAELSALTEAKITLAVGCLRMELAEKYEQLAAKVAVLEHDVTRLRLAKAE